MSGLYQITVTEARGQVAVAADIDQLAIVLGCSSSGSGLSSFYLSSTAAHAGVGYGDAVDTLGQIIEQKQPDGSATKRPAALYKLPSATAGSYGTINVTGVTGTSVITTHTATTPLGTYEAKIRVIAGGTIATAGITFVWSLDGGRTESPIVALGTATTYAIPNSGVQFDFATGTLVAGDVVTVRTIAPAPDASGVTAAMTALAAASVQFGILVCDFDLTAAIAAALSSGLTSLNTAGKRPLCLTRTRLPDAETSETDAAWATDAASDFLSFSDSRMACIAIYGLLTDAHTARQYLRSGLAQFAADVVRVARSEWPDCPADRKMANFSLVNATGVTVGHDEGPRGSSTGLSNDALGNRFCCVQRLPDASRLEDVFTTVPWVMYAADERIRNVPTRRVCNAIELTAVAAGISLGGSNRVKYTPASGTTPARLTDEGRRVVHGVIYNAVATAHRQDIQNPDDAALDTGLVRVMQDITVSGGNLLHISVTIAPVVKGYVLELAVELAVQQ